MAALILFLEQIDCQHNVMSPGTGECETAGIPNLQWYLHGVACSWSWCRYKCRTNSCFMMCDCDSKSRPEYISNPQPSPSKWPPRPPCTSDGGELRSSQDEARVTHNLSSRSSSPTRSHLLQACSDEGIVTWFVHCTYRSVSVLLLLLMSMSDMF